jgi:hypothetical protein
MAEHLPWTWDEINGDWLLGNRLALPPDAIVEAFNRAEKVLGREWIEAARMQSGTQTGGRGQRSTLLLSANCLRAWRV